ncbi:MAG: DUF2796 domain-containing protein [Candidatus Tectimicrobiota bacterium]
MQARRRGWLAAGMVVVLLGLGTTGALAASQHAHEHGTGRVNIVLEGTQATVEVLAPAESIYGFEHRARTAADQQRRDAALERLKANISTMIVFEAERGCTFMAKQVAVVEEQAHQHGKGRAASKSAEHSEVQAEFQVQCAKPLTGSQVTFGITKTFPALHRVQVQVLSATGQRGAEIKRDRGRVTLP